MTYALITGASKGIGKAIAEELAANGHNLLLAARSEAALQQVSTELSEKYKISTAYLAIDLTETGGAEKLYRWCLDNHYQVQILVNNAGYGLSGAFEKYDRESNLNMMRLNMTVPVELIQLFLPELKKQSRAYIMNIASSAAYQAVPGLSLYAATKAFILRFSRGLRQELKGSSVSVTCISPGATDTDFTVRAQIGEKGLKAAARLNMTPEAVAKISVKALLAGKSEVITGAVNKLGAVMAWLLPKELVEKTTYNLYK